MANTKAVRERVARLLSEALNIRVPTDETDLFESGVLDSLGFVELLLRLEHELGVTTSADDLEADNFRTIACIADFVITRTSVREARDESAALSFRSA